MVDDNNVPLLLSFLWADLFFASSVLDFIFSLRADFSAVLRMVDTAVLCRISGKPNVGSL